MDDTGHDEEPGATSRRVTKRVTVLCRGPKLFERIDFVGNYRHSRNYENLQRVIFDGVGLYDIPAIEPIHVDNDDIPVFIGFNYAKSCPSPGHRGLHFFVDDYQFIRLWTNPDSYLPLLDKFKYVLSPDFSTYTDYPLVMQLYSHYRKHWLAAYWQAHGIKVIPTVSWSDESSFAWCFDGEPVGGAVAISSVGTQMSKAGREGFLRGYNEMMERLKPETILFTGKVPAECEGNIIPIGTFQDRLAALAIENENRNPKEDDV